MIIANYKITTVKTGKWRQNCYIVQHLPSKELLLIDPGDEFSAIQSALEHQNGTLRHIILTHAHHDHVGALKEICDTYGIAFIFHRDDLKILKRAPMYALAFESKVIQPADRYQFLESADLGWAGDQIRHVHTPGHTQGGTCYYFGGIAFTGDTLLNRRIGRTDLPGAKPAILASSVDCLMDTLPGDFMVYPGHGDPWVVADARSWWGIHRKAPPEYTQAGHTS